MIGRLEDWGLIIGRLEIDYWKIGDLLLEDWRLEIEDRKIGSWLWEDLKIDAWKSGRLEIDCRKPGY